MCRPYWSIYDPRLSLKPATQSKQEKPNLSCFQHLQWQQWIHRRPPQKPLISATQSFMSTSRLWKFLIYPSGMASPSIIYEVLSKPSKPPRITTQNTSPQYYQGHLEGPSDYNDKETKWKKEWSIFTGESRSFRLSWISLGKMEYTQYINGIWSFTLGCGNRGAINLSFS